MVSNKLQCYLVMDLINNFWHLIHVERRALLGTRLYIDFSGKYQFQPKWKELIKELRVHNILPDQHASEQTTTGTYCI
jgi:hypothetical protein